MSNATVTKAASPKLPRSATKVTLVSGGALTNTIIFTAGDVERYVTFHATTSFHLRFADGASTATVSAGDMLYPGGQLIPFKVDAAGALQARGTAAGDFYYHKE